MIFSTFEWAAIDGSVVNGSDILGPPSGGTIAFPGLFTGLTGTVYGRRPPWKVADVDYAVGPAAGTATKNPLVDALPASWSVDNTNKFIRTNGTSGVTLDGWDFSLTNGYRLYLASSSQNITITNTKFAAGANGQNPIFVANGSGPITCRYCEFDGGLGNYAADQMIQSTGPANVVAEYCRFKNFNNDAINVGGLGGDDGGDHLIRFCSFSNFMWIAEKHSDMIQTLNGPNSLRWLFNTLYQPAPDGVTGFPGAGNNMVRVADASGASVTRDIEIGRNTIISIGATGHNFEDVNDHPGMGYLMGISASAPKAIRGLRIFDNYVDQEGTFGFIYPTPGNAVFQAAVSGNIDLRTGLQIAPPY